MTQDRVLHPVRLMGEGKTDADFLYELSKRLGLTETIWAEEFTPPGDSSGGISKLPQKLQSIVISPEFQTKNNKILGVMRDADADAERAFQSVCGMFQSAGLPVPETAGSLSDYGIRDVRTAVLIVPKQGSGTLEDVILGALSEDHVLNCIDKAFPDIIRCLEESEQRLSMSKHQKARYQMYLAARGGRLHDDTALKMSWFPWHSPQFDLIRDFLNLLAESVP